jgi:hypothetical protein
VNRAAAGRRAAVILALAGTAAITPAAVVAFETSIGIGAIKRAIDIGRSPGSESLRDFHDGYVIPLGDRLLDRLEIVTEFRRVVLETENRVRFADMRWGPEQAEAMLRPWRGKVSLLLYVTFAPNNTYRAMPRFGIVLYARPPTSGAQVRQASAIEPIDLVETPRYISGQPAPPGTPIMAGIVEATFAARMLDPRGAYLAGIFLEDRELRRVDVDLAGIE